MRKIAFSISLDPGQVSALDRIARVTRIQRSTLLREAVEAVLEKYGKADSPEPDPDGTIAAQTGCD